MEQKVKDNLILMNKEIKRLKGQVDVELLDIEGKFITNRENPRAVREQINDWFEWVDLYDKRIESLERQVILLESMLQEDKDE